MEVVSLNIELISWNDSIKAKEIFVRSSMVANIFSESVYLNCLLHIHVHVSLSKQPVFYVW